MFFIKGIGFVVHMLYDDGRISETIRLKGGGSWETTEMIGTIENASKIIF